MGKTKQLILNLCDLLGHQNLQITSARLNKYLIQIRDNRKLALPFFISNFGSILLGEMVQVHIVSVKDELFIELVIPFTDKDLFLLYEMQPFPVFQAHLEDGTVAAYIKPRADYIAVGDSSDRYLFLNQTDLNKCNERNTFFLCENEFYFENYITCEKMLLSKPDYGELPLCNIQFSQGRTQYFQRMTNKRLWLASAINKLRLEVMCSGHILKMPLSGSQIIELPKNCKMRIEEREVYGFDGNYNEEDLIIPNIKLNVHNELVYKREKQSTQYRIESRGEISAKDWVYILLYLFLTIILVGFLGIFAYLAFQVFKKRDQRVEETHVEDGYVPMFPLDPTFRCNFRGIADYEEPRNPPLPVKNSEVNLPSKNGEASTSTATV